jgi:hypothetical protein
MQNKIICARCRDVDIGPAVKVPGPSLHHITVDQLVCLDCQADHNDHMENNFWKGAACSDPGKCPKCKDGLTGQNSRPAYRKANSDGTQELTLLCVDCHAEYQEQCQAAANK